MVNGNQVVGVRVNGFSVVKTLLIAIRSMASRYARGTNIGLITDPLTPDPGITGKTIFAV